MERGIMPKYKKKITALMSYEQFKKAITELPIDRQAFLSILFFAGCRISEALALTSSNVHCTRDTIFVDFFRLKGSQQTDPIPLPRTAPLEWICEQEGELFSFCRQTGYRTVKRAFPILYPHYFRMNRIVSISDKFGDATVYSYVGICANSIDHYRGKVDVKRVGRALLEEVS
jgi:integrase